MRVSASATLTWPSACFLVQPAPVTKSRSASGRIVCWSAAGASKAGDPGARRRGVLGRRLRRWRCRRRPCHAGGDAAFEREQPRAGAAGEDGFHALAVEPPRDAWLAVGGGEAGDVGVGAAAEAMGDAGQHAVPAGGGRGGDKGGRCGAAKGFRRGGIGGIAGLANSGPVIVRNRVAPQVAMESAAGPGFSPIRPTLNGAPRAAASWMVAARASSADLARVPSGSVWARKRVLMGVGVICYLLSVRSVGSVDRSDH